MIGASLSQLDKSSIYDLRLSTCNPRLFYIVFTKTLEFL